MVGILDKENRLKLLLHVAVLLFSLIGIVRRDKISDETSLFERLMIDTVAPIQESIITIRDKTNYFFDNYIYLVNVKKNSSVLETEVSELQAKIFNLKELEKENLRLKSLLKFSEEFSYDRVLARVIGWDSNSDIRVIRINKGSNDGIYPEAPVVAADGVVGYVFRVTENYSDIMTILNQENRVDAIVSRTRSHGIVEGYSNGKCIMKYVTRSEPIENGDYVMTSGLGKVYPKGLRIGQVTRIERESYGIVQFVEIAPGVDFGKLEEVIILLVSKQENLDENAL